MEYDSANCLTKYNGEDVIYDVKGNMTYGPVDGKMTELTYDCRNRLVKAGNVSYTYDCKNTRIATEEDGITTEYVTDTGGSLSRMLIAYENVGTDKSSETHYFYGAEGLSCQNNDSTGQYFSYHYDNIGSTTLITDKTGRKVEEFAYGTYGELLTEVVNNIRFLYNGSYGVVTDSNGLYYMRARYYNPDIKRFINQDIKVGNITNGQSLNRYAYCEGNPVSMVDPFGLCGQSALFNEFFSLGVHLVLGGLGMIPAGGNLFDLADAAFSYCYDKDPVGAGVSLACALPWTGIVAGAGKFGKNAIKLSDKKLDVIKGSRRVVNTTDMAADTVKVGREMKRLGIMDNLGRVFVKSEKIGDFLKNGGEVLKRVAGALKKGDDLYTSVRKLAKGSDQYVSNIKKKNRGFAYWPFGGSGTVWDKITPTQENYINTSIPRSFEIDVNGQKMWVHGNASEHIYEDVYKGFTVGSGTAHTNPDLYSQLLLSDFHGSLEIATKNGINYGEIINQGKWEFKFAKPRQPGQLPAIIHAQFNGWY